MLNIPAKESASRIHFSEFVTGGKSVAPREQSHLGFSLICRLFRRWGGWVGGVGGVLAHINSNKLSVGSHTWE